MFCASLCLGNNSACRRVGEGLASLAWELVRQPPPVALARARDGQRAAAVGVQRAVRQIARDDRISFCGSAMRRPVRRRRADEGVADSTAAPASALVVRPLRLNWPTVLRRFMDDKERRDWPGKWTLSALQHACRPGTQAPMCPGLLMIAGDHVTRNQSIISGARATSHHRLQHLDSSVGWGPASRLTGLVGSARLPGSARPVEHHVPPERHRWALAGKSQLRI